MKEIGVMLKEDEGTSPIGGYMTTQIERSLTQLSLVAVRMQNGDVQVPF
jgi:hypothetical protein